MKMVKDNTAKSPLGVQGQADLFEVNCWEGRVYGTDILLD